MVTAEAETLLHHEWGEALDRSLGPLLWRSLISQFPFSRIELYLRSLKDLLADTHPRGTLAYIIQHRQVGSLGFYLSNLRGLRRVLFPEWVEGTRMFQAHGDWSVLEQARKRGRSRFRTYAKEISGLVHQFLPRRKADFSARFEDTFLRPLGY